MLEVKKDQLKTEDRAVTYLSKIFKSLADPMRIKILQNLEKRDYCVCELIDVLKISQPTVSYHISLLADAGLITTHKEGRKVICKLEKKGLFNKLLNVVE